jgi:hypothetical protein
MVGKYKWLLIINITLITRFKTELFQYADTTVAAGDVDPTFCIYYLILLNILSIFYNFFLLSKFLLIFHQYSNCHKNKIKTYKFSKGKC